LPFYTCTDIKFIGIYTTHKNIYYNDICIFNEIISALNVMEYSIIFLEFVTLFASD